MISLTLAPYWAYYIGMSTKQHTEAILAKAAAERLHLDRRNVVRMIERGALNARLVTEAPRPYYLIAVDSLFLAEEAARNEKARSQAAT